MVGLIKLGFVLVVQNKHQILFPLSSPFTGGNENSLTLWWKAEAENVTRLNSRKQSEGALWLLEKEDIVYILERRDAEPARSPQPLRGGQ